jgi:hypothetical protein
MKVSRLKAYAILTGDVVASSKMPLVERRELPQMLRRGSQQLDRAFPGAAPLAIDIFRGDSWQLLATKAALSLRIGLFFRAYIIASSSANDRWDTRMAVAVGGIDFLPAKRVSEGDGEAYRLSGQALDGLREPDRLRFVSAKDDLPEQAVTVRFIDALARGWTAPQARAVLGRLQGWRQAEIANLWPEPIAQQAVGRHLEKANWTAVEHGLRLIENSLQEL